jgi:hypothetical protein
MIGAAGMTKQWSFSSAPDLAGIMQRFELRAACGAVFGADREFSVVPTGIFVTSGMARVRSGRGLWINGTGCFRGRHAPPLRWRDAGFFRARTARCPVRNTMSANEP